MKLVSLDPKRTKVVVTPQSGQDLWRLSELLEEGDRVTARTERKISVGTDAVVRKPMVLSLLVQRAEVQGDILRISGTVAEGTDDVARGAHHSFAIALHDDLTIEKGTGWASWQLEKLQEEDSHVILLLVMDREEAVFAVLRREPEVLATVKGAVQKKGMDGGSPYWQELATMLSEHDERIKPRHVVVASPAFFKEYVIQLLPEGLRKKTVAATISATGAAAISELVRRPEVRQVLARERYSTESVLVDAVLEAIHKDKGAWGLAEVAEMAVAGALETVLVTSAFLQRARHAGNYAAVAQALADAERTKAVVHILDTSAAEQLERLGGIAAVKRW
jgi:mRNA surveillance protein pelota